MSLESLWFGSDESSIPYLRYLDFMDNISATDIQGYVDDDEEFEDDLPALAQIEGSVGIININGSLVPNGNWITRMFGMTGYDEIAEAAAALNDRDDVSDIVLSINSGGGAVMGLESVGNTLKLVAKNKPVYSNTEGSMLSAAYWIGSVGRDISGTSMSQFGSIGVIITHTSVHRALKESGRDVTIIRAGKFKAPGHPAEKLSAKAKQELQDRANDMAGFFRSHIESERSDKLSAWDSWGEGKVFFADEAVSVGLSDRLVTLNGLVTQLNKADYEETTDMKQKKKVILQDDQAVAQLESGVSLENVVHQEVEGSVDPAAEDTSLVKTDAENSEDELLAAAAAAAAEDNADADADAAVEPSKGDSALLTHLKDEVATLREDLSTAKAETIGLRQQLTTATANQTSLVAIAAYSANRMQIGLGQAPTNLKDQSADAVVEQHTAVQKQFSDTFHVGQLSAEAPVEDKDKAKVLPIDLGLVLKDTND